MRKMSKYQIFRTKKYIRMNVYLTSLGGRYFEIKYKGKFDDPLIRKILDFDKSKLFFKCTRRPLSRYTMITYTITQDYVSDYVHGMNKISGLECSQVNYTKM